jgi:hypothetical protein
MPKANPEAALAEFERLAAAADVNIDVSTMDQESADDVNEVRDLMTQAIMDGRLAVDEEGRAVLSVSDGSAITFRVPLGEDLMIMANARKDSRTIGKLSKKEWKLAMRLAGFLSAD